MQKMDYVSRVLNHLLINAAFERNLGLYNGKIGMAISLYHYASYTCNEIYKEYADSLIEQIYDSIHWNLSVDMQNGLCGIAWGMCYLMRNDFLDGAAEDIFKDIDEKIMDYLPIYRKDLSLETGIKGIWTYINERKLLADQIKVHTEIDTSFFRECEIIILEKQLNSENMITFFTTQNLVEIDDIINLQLGLMNGCSGYILKQVMS